MHTIHQPPVSDETLPAQESTPYFLWCEEFDRRVTRLAAALGLPPDRLAA